MNNVNKDSVYSKPLLYAVLLHIVVLALLVLQLSWPSHLASGAPQANIIHAVAVSQTALDNYQNQITAQKAAQAEALAKAQQIIANQVKAQQQAAVAKAMAAKAAAQKIADAKAAAVAKAEQAVKAQKAAQDAKAQKLLKQELAQDFNKQLKSDQKEISQNAAKTADAKVMAAKAADAKAAAAAKADAAAKAQASQDASTVDKYKALIIQTISQQWIVPPNLPKNISCQLDVRLAPGGVVLSAKLTKSSGNAALDQSAVAAVYKASPLPVPPDSELFDKFRELSLTVRPDGTMAEN